MSSPFEWPVAAMDNQSDPNGGTDHVGPLPNSIWLFLVERGVNDGSDLRVFWHESGAVDAAREYLADCFPPEDLDTLDGVYEAVERTNHQAGDHEYLVLASFPVI